jgi:peptidoglycan/xylan/chitin deacetylase (PgdA/CDA1 family)
MKIAQRLSDDSLAIFLFHGVIEKSNCAVRNYTKKHLEKDDFYRFMRKLKKKGHPLSMADVMEHHANGEPYPPRAFAITFDDGFENNYSVAAPILSDFGIPATFYITTGFVENNYMSWIDRIEYCLESTPAGRICLPWAQDSYPFGSAEDKIGLLAHLRDYVKQNESIDVDRLACEIFFQCGLDIVEQSDDPLDLKMNWQQVKELDNDDNFIIGGHTHRHMILSYLRQDELEDEIRTSVEFLEQKAGICSPHYSYPEGLEYCYSDEVIEVLMNHGISCCPTAEDGVNRAGASLFHLKRIMIG